MIFPIKSPWQLEERGGYTQACEAEIPHQRDTSPVSTLGFPHTLSQLVKTVLAFLGSCEVFPLLCIASDFVTIRKQNSSPLCPICFGSVACYVTAQI